MASPFRTFNLNVAGGLGIFSGGILLWILYHGPTAAQIGAGSLTTVRGGAVTDTRASNKTCNTNASGSTVKILSSNQPCVDTVGLNVEGSATNLMLQSQALATAPWSVFGSIAAAPTVTNNTADVAAPDGSQTATKLDYPATTAGGAESEVFQSVTTTGAAHTFSIYLRTASGTATVYVSSDAVSAGSSFVACSVTATWTRCTLSNTLTAAAHNVQLGVNQGRSETGQPAMTVYAWGFQLETGTFPTSYIATTGTTATRAADAVSVANPLPAGASTYCLGVTATPAAGTWNTGANQVLLSVGTNGFGNHSISMWVNSSGKPSMDVIDDVGGDLFLNANAVPASTAHRFVMCRTGATTLTYSLDGTSPAASVGGTSGTLTQPTTMSIGQSSGSPFYGQLSDMCVSGNATGCK